jgi:hypothetical protein
MAVWRDQRAGLGLALMSRRFPPPWSVEETDACFISPRRQRAGARLLLLHLSSERRARRCVRHDLPAVALALEYLNPIALPRRHIGIGVLRRERAVGYRGLAAFERLNSVNWHAQHDSFLVHPLNKFRVHAHGSAVSPDPSR